MSMSLGVILCVAISVVQLAASGDEHKPKTRRWLGDDDPLGTFSANLRPPGLEDTVGYNRQVWPTDERRQLNSPKNNSFHLVPNWPDPSVKFGQLSAVSFDSDGNIVLFHRGDRIWDANTFQANNVFNRDLGVITQPTLVVINASTGLKIHEWGSNLFYLPHGLTIDSNNNVWLTDVGLHQIFKFPPGGASKPLLTLGVAFVPGNDDTHFCKPAAVAVMKNGDFFVADGYCNTRIMKFNKKGDLIMQWGRNSLQGVMLQGRDIPPYQFSVPHALALAEDREMLCVADRENGRVQCFNCHNGTFLTQFRSKQMGSRIFSVAYSPAKGGLLFVVNGPEFMNESHVRGFVISLAKNQIIEEFGPGGRTFENPHDIAVNGDASQLYVVEFRPFKAWKFVNGEVNSTYKAPVVSVNYSTPPMKTATSSSGINSSKLQVVEVPVESSPASTIATAIGVVTGLFVLIAIVIFAAVLKMRKRGCLLGPNSHHKRWDFPMSQTEGFKLGQFLDRHQGFEKVSTEESDEENSNNALDLRQQGSQFA